MKQEKYIKVLILSSLYFQTEAMKDIDQEIDMNVLRAVLKTG